MARARRIALGLLRGLLIFLAALFGVLSVAATISQVMPDQSKTEWRLLLSWWLLFAGFLLAARGAVARRITLAALLGALVALCAGLSLLFR